MARERTERAAGQKAVSVSLGYRISRHLCVPSSGRQTCTLSEDVSFVVNSGTAPRHTAELKPSHSANWTKRNCSTVNCLPKTRTGLNIMLWRHLWFPQGVTEAFCSRDGSTTLPLLPGRWALYPLVPLSTVGGQQHEIYTPVLSQALVWIIWHALARLVHCISDPISTCRGETSSKCLEKKRGICLESKHRQVLL